MPERPLYLSNAEFALLLERHGTMTQLNGDSSAFVAWACRRFNLQLFTSYKIVVIR